MGTIQADLNELKSLEQKIKNAKAKIDVIPGQLSFSLSGALSELSGVWNGELEGLQQELEKSIRDYSEELGRAGQVVSKTYQELKAADEALLEALGLDSEIAPQKTSKGKAEGASKKKEEEEEGNTFTQSLKGIGDGAGDALSDTWDGIVSFAKHPVDSTVDTAKGVYEAGKHPIRTYNTVKDGVVTAVDKKLIHGDAYSRSHFFAYAGTEVGLAALGDKGAGLAVKGAGAVSKTAKGMKEVHKVTMNQKAPALQPAFAGRPGSRPPYNTLNTGYLGRYLQNAKDMYWNSSKVSGSRVLYRKEDLLPTSADIGEHSPLAPGGGLMAHESNEKQRKGHLIEKHVGKTDEELLQRLNTDARASGSSTFTDRATAERVVNQALSNEKNMRRIERWLNDTEDTKPLRIRYQGEEIIGRGIQREKGVFEDYSRALIVLKKKGQDSFIVTGYPR
ncbi:RNase A-like domain-containing protein [Priestia endophytica]|uniref:RNase A-like domain-containing protein n=1 Tax=Priestia endophytica TaxID=135735 RepID=UPI00115DB40A|nr:RNase A-like domain-containing protein [Priestia endophytica]